MIKLVKGQEEDSEKEKFNYQFNLLQNNFEAITELIATNKRKIQFHIKSVRDQIDTLEEQFDKDPSELIKFD